MKPILAKTDSGTEVIVPLIHLNGTSAKELQSQLVECLRSLRFAESGLFCPNARDFYPMGPDAVHDAQWEHEDRVERLKALIGEFDAIEDAVQEQVNARARR